MTYMGRGIFKGRRARGFHACREVRAANPKGGFWLLLVLLSALPGGFLRGASDNQRSAAYAKLPNVGNLPTLTHIEQVRGLTLEEAQRGYPVRLRAVVTYCHAADGDLFIQDSTAGIWVDPKKINLNLRSGQMIEVEGTAGVGDFSPESTAPRSRYLARLLCRSPAESPATNSPPAARTASGWKWRLSCARRSSAERT